MLKNDAVFQLSENVKKLFSFLITHIIGPWVLYRISIRNGDIDTMMRSYFTNFLNLAIVSNCYKYTNMVLNDWTDTLNLELLAANGHDDSREMLNLRNLAYSMKVSTYSNSDTNGQSQDLRLEEQIKRGKFNQTTKMGSLEAFRLIEPVDILKLRHDIVNNNKDTVQNYDSFTTALIASLQIANKKDTLPVPSNEFWNFKQVGNTTANDILLSKELDSLGDSSYNATFRPIFITETQENEFNADFTSHSLIQLFKDARTKASLQNPDKLGLTHFSIDQLELSELSATLKKQFLICIINEMNEQG